MNQIQPLKEITVSCSVGLALLFLFAGRSGEISRATPQPEPVVANIDERWHDLAVKSSTAPPPAPDQGKARDQIVVAVIDTGCDILHPQLKDHIWVNRGEIGEDEYGLSKTSNGIDDDDNGFVDDVHGWNFIGRSNDVFDEHGHGTHVAGVISSSRELDGLSLGDDGPRVSLMILKYYDTHANGMENLTHTIDAIRYAVRMGANIINYSGGGFFRSREEEETIRWAGTKGVLVIAAAGNDGVNTDFFHFYPADYELPNILSVAATDGHDQLLNISNFGLHTVHVAAPGKGVFSTLPNGQYGYLTGTSQATAAASQAAALLMARDPSLRDPERLIRYLITHATSKSALKGKVAAGGIVDLTHLMRFTSTQNKTASAHLSE